MCDLVVSVRVVDANGSRSEPGESPSFCLWDPTAISSLLIWLDWADPETTFGDGDCTLPAAGVDTIDCMRDKSGNNNHLVSWVNPFGDYGPVPSPGPQLGEINGTGLGLRRTARRPSRS